MRSVKSEEWRVQSKAGEEYRWKDKVSFERSFITRFAYRKMISAKVCSRKPHQKNINQVNPGLHRKLSSTQLPFFCNPCRWWKGAFLTRFSYNKIELFLFLRNNSDFYNFNILTLWHFKWHSPVKSVNF